MFRLSSKPVQHIKRNNISFTFHINSLVSVNAINCSPLYISVQWKATAFKATGFMSITVFSVFQVCHLSANALDAMSVYGLSVAIFVDFYFFHLILHLPKRNSTSYSISSMTEF